MQKYTIWKPETDNKTLPTGLPPIERHQKEIQYPVQGDIKTLLRTNCEVERIMRFLRWIEIFEEI